ncbi:MAG: DNA (cytosine-5-)-methyltransferase [Brevinema sp.]
MDLCTQSNIDLVPPKKTLKTTQKTIRFIDLFAGLGGTRIGFEEACSSLNLDSECVFTSEIKESAIQTYQENFGNEKIYGDITKIKTSNIPDHDFILAGFPCQPFSVAGTRKGFLDKRGGLFFTILEILQNKKPAGFILENVEGIVAHNNGKTLETILQCLKALEYRVSWAVLDSSDFGVPQKRKRVYITGHKNKVPNLQNFPKIHKNTESCIENIPYIPSEFSNLLSCSYSYQELYGKSIKDKRGGENNIHSWNIGLKGKVSQNQQELLSLLLKQRRYKKWAELKGIEWMDGMPLTINEIKTFYDHPDLEFMLNDLCGKGYLVFEHPKQQVIIDGIKKRIYHTQAPKGYNIVTGKLSFPIAKIISPNDVAPTIVATEVGKIGISDPRGVRPITIREALRFSGFPETYHIKLDYRKAYDLIGNTVMPPVITEVSKRVLQCQL